MLFLRFTARALPALAISHFKLDIIHVSKPPHQKNIKYCAICNQVVQYTVLNNGRENSFNRKRQFRSKSTTDYSNHFQMRIAYVKTNFIRY